MRLVFIGRSLSSSCGNGHATTYGDLLRALAARGHDIVFLERKQPLDAARRDLPEPHFCRLKLYDSVADLGDFAPDVATPDAVVIGSFVQQGTAVIDWAASRNGGLCFFDIDTPETLRLLGAGGADYLLPRQIPLFDVYFSSTGGSTLRLLVSFYGARRAEALNMAEADRAAIGAAGRQRTPLQRSGIYPAAELERYLLACKPSLRW